MENKKKHTNELAW